MQVIRYARQRVINPVVLLFIFSCFCTGILLVRMIVADQIRYIFLAWNLFLAWVPLLITLFLSERLKTGSQNRYCFGLGLLVWLLFLPNSPYIITDLLHLKGNTHVPIWFDSILVFSFALAGLLCGLFSLYLAHLIIDRLFNEITGWLSIVGCVGLTGFGIYLGRVERWNSWDLFTNPVQLLMDSLQQISNPVAIKMTIGFTCLLLFFYLLFLSLIHLKINASPEKRR
ncbi:DUF1361 domain-containing protein [Rhodocytophaga rosea]|uniref:DUF1361 domain-containing protein n=1 Tax=Rhodocytophaga rosea TaxID=2704465 RepID=A0A6C0GI29_9BACT|nr:DUF1361 domain-containing protein [Rhodocytophaga rosea]QHT67619.1 DUF1361 domain-containing protein [Rhodocytophaga rosea]